MDDKAAQENPSQAFNKLDLSQLSGFSFGTQWSQEKSAPQDGQERGAPRPPRDDRRDRRPVRRAGDDQGGRSAPDQQRRSPTGPSGPSTPNRFQGDRPQANFRREPQSDNRPRQDYRGGRPQEERGGYQNPRDRMPYESQVCTIAFYPEDNSFNALVKTIRASCRTIELFEIARTVLGKIERFTVLVTPREQHAPLKPSDDKGTGEQKVDAKRKSFVISIPDGIPFVSEDEAIAHVLNKHLDKYFDKQDVEVEPPKGNFQVVNRCGMTGELLGPPNYHRYAQIVQQHYTAANIRVPFDAYRSKVESVRDPEMIAKWLEKMKKVTRYTWKNPNFQRKQAKVVETPKIDEVLAAPSHEDGASPGSQGTDVTEDTPAATPIDSAPAAEVAVLPEAVAATEVAPVITFDSFEDARTYLLTAAREKLVRFSTQVRVHGRDAEALPDGEIRRSIEGALERQRRFPLDTANALRGRLRREHFTIFKKGSKGISYVCAVKRKFRVPGQTFADSIGALISFIEKHPMVKAGDLAKRYLGITETTPDSVPSNDGTPTPSRLLSMEEREKIARLQGDLLWLVREGYVTEFIDGGLYASPPMVESRKKQAESDEVDPENFPEAAPSGEPHVVPVATETEGVAKTHSEETPAPDNQTPPATI